MAQTQRRPAIRSGERFIGHHTKEQFKEVLFQSKRIGKKSRRQSEIGEALYPVFVSEREYKAMEESLIG